MTPDGNREHERQEKKKQGPVTRRNPRLQALAATHAMGANGMATKKETMAEMAASEKIEVVHETKEGKKAVSSDEDLETLLDRSPKLFDERGERWVSRGARTKIMGEAGDGQSDPASFGGGRKAAFAVYQGLVSGEDA